MFYKRSILEAFDFNEVETPTSVLSDNDNINLLQKLIYNKFPLISKAIKNKEIQIEQLPNNIIAIYLIGKTNLIKLTSTTFDNIKSHYGLTVNYIWDSNYGNFETPINDEDNKFLSDICRKYLNISPIEWLVSKITVYSNTFGVTFYDIDVYYGHTYQVQCFLFNIDNFSESETSLKITHQAFVNKIIKKYYIHLPCILKEDNGDKWVLENNKLKLNLKNYNLQPINISSVVNTNIITLYNLNYNIFNSVSTFLNHKLRKYTINGSSGGSNKFNSDNVYAKLSPTNEVYMDWGNMTMDIADTSVDTQVKVHLSNFKDVRDANAFTKSNNQLIIPFKVYLEQGRTKKLLIIDYYVLCDIEITGLTKLNKLYKTLVKE